jgi:hypothetical protein
MYGKSFTKGEGLLIVFLIVLSSSTLYRYSKYVVIFHIHNIKNKVWLPRYQESQILR